MAKTDEYQPRAAVPSDSKDVGVEFESQISRRRALIAGLAAAPAVLTLIRRPVWATTRMASPTICASLAAASSLHAGDTELAAKCEELQAPTTTQTTTSQ